MSTRARLGCAATVSRQIAKLRSADLVPDAIAGAIDKLKRDPGHAESLLAIEHAMSLATTRTPDADTVEQLGGGWIAEEAVAISLYCVLISSLFQDAVLLAVNHSGDSDSTGAITGNLWGLMHGIDAIPATWLERLELRDEITAIADLFSCLATCGPVDEGKAVVWSPDLEANRAQELDQRGKTTATKP